MLTSVDDFRGQVAVRSLRDAYLGKQRLGGTILLLGQRGLGKTTLATLIARALVCERNIESPRLWFCGECYACRSILQGEQPEYVVVRPRGQDISVTQIEEDHNGFSSALLHPTLLSHRIFIIDDAHCLNEQTGNQLLKLFEESPERTVFILVTDKPEMLLPTIHSRGQKLRLVPSACGELAGHAAADTSAGPAEAMEAARMSGGRYVDATALAAMPRWREAVRRLGQAVFSGRAVLAAAQQLSEFEYDAMWAKLLADLGLSAADAERMLARPKTDEERKFKTRRNELRRQALVAAYDRATWWALGQAVPPAGYARALWDLKTRINQNVDPRLAQTAFELAVGV